MRHCRFSRFLALKGAFADHIQIFKDILFGSCTTGVSRHLHPVLFNLIMYIRVWLCTIFFVSQGQSRESDHFCYVFVTSVDEVKKSLPC